MKKDTCPNGHKWDEDNNTYVNMIGVRICRACRRASAARNKPVSRKEFGRLKA